MMDNMQKIIIQEPHLSKASNMNKAILILGSLRTHLGTNTKPERGRPHNSLSDVWIHIWTRMWPLFIEHCSWLFIDVKKPKHHSYPPVASSL